MTNKALNRILTTVLDVLPLVGSAPSYTDGQRSIQSRESPIKSRVVD
jgi:hypothetical protein